MIENMNWIVFFLAGTMINVTYSIIIGLVIKILIVSI